MKKTYLPKLFLIINADIIDPAKLQRYNGSILLKNGKKIRLILNRAYQLKLLQIEG